jgi:serine/threonine protein phosphatase 1
MNKTFVIGDIHGSYKGLLQCIERSGFNNEEDTLICLGDIVDGYPESKECIDYLMTIKNFILLWGNHCYWFYEWLKYGYMPSIWTTQGGFATLKSFDYTVDDKYIEFFDKALPYYIDDKNNLYVHGGFNPYIELEENEFRVLIWDRDLIEYAKYLHETYLHETETPVRSINKFRNHIYRELSKYNNIFVGHTTTQRYESLVPVNFYNLWMLDTGAGWNEKLSIMDIDTKEYWQSDRSIDLYGKNQGR